MRSITALMLALVLSGSVFCGELLLMTEDYPPQSFFNKDKELAGICVDMVREIQRRAHNDSKIQVKVWVDALKELDKNPNSAVFSMAKNPIRSKKYELVGPISQNAYMFYVKADSDIKVTSLEDAKKYRIGVFKNDICHQFLIGQGFNNLVIADSDYNNLDRLLKGDIEIWAVGQLKANFRASEKNIPMKKIKAVYTAFVSDLYVAFNKKADKKTVKAWNKALQSMRDDGTFDKIKDEWARKWQDNEDALEGKKTN